MDERVSGALEVSAACHFQLLGCSSSARTPVREEAEDLRRVQQLGSLCRAFFEVIATTRLHLDPTFVTGRESLARNPS